MWTTTVRIETDGSSASVDVPALEDLRVEAVPYWNGRRTAGVTVGSIGLAGLLVGAITGGIAVSKASSAKPHCQPLGDATACDPTGLALRSDVRAFGNAANVSLALGAAATVAGVVLFVTAPGAAEKPATGLRFQVAPAFGMNGATLALQGVW